MRKSIQRAASFLAMSCAVYFTFIGYGMAALPEEISVTQSQSQSGPNAPYSAQVLAEPGKKILANKNTEQDASLKLLGIFPVKAAKLKQVRRSYVVAGGEIFGIKLYTRGVLVAKTDMVTTVKGNENPAQAAGLRSGDVITAINGREVNRKKEVSAAVENSGGTPLQMTVERGGTVLHLQCTPVKGASGDKYLAGLWVRDSSAGIGTVSFWDAETGAVAGLGHAICDVDSGEIIPISWGEMVSARVMGCYKGTDGAPGELCGVFEDKTLARLHKNGPTGVYGTINGPAPAGERIPVALKSEVRTGPAQIIVTTSGTEKRTYDVEITKVSSNANAVQKNMVIRVTDPELIAVTGGIVQGMSGSPLLQGDMLVGAVTHVFVNSPLEGYAIFAETMLQSARGGMQTK